ncbi:hypothetical protein CVU37_07525 [candidate division BRC1 bacterium HGW-BRC1-1]|jgi:hypothetical protein|nr:MAG: hypothetical protein CVU37_07525 [candidate division BRC1 bacterium HGW-BRC1-1]
MKTRDIIKYAFAALIAGATIAAITVLQVVKYQRANRSGEESRRIEQVFRQDNLGAALPTAVETPTPTAPVATPEPRPTVPASVLQPGNTEPSSPASSSAILWQSAPKAPSPLDAPADPRP